jgi:hypothetical protein
MALRPIISLMAVNCAVLAITLIVPHKVANYVEWVSMLQTPTCLSVFFVKKGRLTLLMAWTGVMTASLVLFQHLEEAVAIALYVQLANILMHLVVLCATFVIMASLMFLKE